MLERDGYCLNNPLINSDPSGMFLKAFDESDIALDAYFSQLCDRNMTSSYFNWTRGGGGGSGRRNFTYDPVRKWYFDELGQSASGDDYVNDIADHAEDLMRQSQTKDPKNVTSEFNNYVSTTARRFSAAGKAIDRLGSPVSYLVKLLYFKEVMSSDLSLNPKGDPNSPFSVPGLYNDHLMNPEDFGNYNYGVAAFALGLSPGDALWGGGFASIMLGGQRTYWNIFGLTDEWQVTKMIFNGYYNRYYKK